MSKSRIALWLVLVLFAGCARPDPLLCDTCKALWEIRADPSADAIRQRGTLRTKRDRSIGGLEYIKKLEAKSDAFPTLHFDCPDCTDAYRLYLLSQRR